MNMAEKYSAVYRGAWKQGPIPPQKPPPKIKEKKKARDKETRKENLN